MKKTLFTMLVLATVMPAMAENRECVSAYFTPYKEDGVLITDYTKYSFYLMVQENSDITSVKTMVADETFSEFTSSDIESVSVVKYHAPWKEHRTEEHKQTEFPTTIDAKNGIWGVSVYQNEEVVRFQIVPVYQTNDLGTQFQFDTDWLKGSGYTSFKPESPTTPEPATATPSLLALAGPASRRRK